MDRRTRTSHSSAPPSSTGRQAIVPSSERRPVRLPTSRALRFAAFAVIALAVGGGAVGLLVSRVQGPAATDVTAIQVHASMGGFDPPALSVKAGQTVKVELISMDSSMHSDGGGRHQFAIDELDVDWQVGPLSSEVFEFTAPTTAGEYSWYCDICCGGKENPSMQGTLTVTA